MPNHAQMQQVLDHNPDLLPERSENEEGSTRQDDHMVGYLKLTARFFRWNEVMTTDMVTAITGLPNGILELTEGFLWRNEIMEVDMVTLKTDILDGCIHSLNVWVGSTVGAYKLRLQKILKFPRDLRLQF